MAGNAVRGFPPAPGDSLPVYPPGPFAAWNRGQPERAGGDRGTWNGLRPGEAADPTSQLATATITPDEFDTNHSIPAIKDPVLATVARSAVPGPRDRAGARGADGRADRRAAPPPAPGRSARPAAGRRADRPASKDRSITRTGQPARAVAGTGRSGPAPAGSGSQPGWLSEPRA